MMETRHRTVAALISLLGLWCSLLAVNTAWMLVMAFLFQWLWNTSLPSVFHAPVISYLQGAKLLGLGVVVCAVIRGVKLKFQSWL